MPATFKYGFFAGAIIASLFALWLSHLWAANNQVRLHSAHFLGQLEKRNSAGAGEFIALDYHDDWGHDRTLVLNRLRMILPVFSTLTITAPAPQVRLRPPFAVWSAPLRLGGTGGEFAPEIIGRVNSLTKPFDLHWRHESWRPWDWKLVQVSNPALALSGALD